MATILCVTRGFAALLYSSLELSRRLEAAGHTVVYASVKEVAPVVERHRLAFRPLSESGYAAFIAADAQRSLLERLVNIRERRRQAAAASAVDDFVEVVREVDPALILIDVELHEHIITALGTGVPTALLNSFASIWRRPGLPPPHHFVCPGRGWRGTAPIIALLWLNLRARKWRTRMAHRIRRVGCDRVSILRLLAASVGVDLSAHADFTQWLAPFTYRTVPVLSLHALELELPHVPASHVQYVGPMVLEDRVDPMPADTRDRLDTLFRWRRDDPQRRLIYAGFGSWFSTERRLLTRLFAAVSERPDWALVVSLGNPTADVAFDSRPENVHVLPWVPQTEVLRHADLTITHGGIGTVEECISAGVPMLVYCGFETDMGGNAARVIHHGLGLVGDGVRDTSRTMQQQIEHLLREPRFRARVAELRAHGLRYRDTRVAERAVEALLTS